MNIIKSILTFISSEYENETYFIRRKTHTFYYALLITIILLILMITALLLLRPHGFLRIVLALIIIFVILTSSLILLKKGHYYLSANIVVTATSLVLILFLFLKLYRDPHTGYTSSLYIMCSIIVTAALLCTKKWLIGTGLTFITSNIVFYCLVIKRLDEDNRQAATVGVIYSIFAMCLILLLSYLIVSIAEGAVTRSEEEAEKSLKNYYAIQSLLESVRESAVSMAKSSGEMKSLTITFSDNFQNQASAAEEITAAMEEVSTSTDNNAASASEQSETISSFLEKLGNLSRTVAGMGGKIRQSTDDVNSISHDATSGETLLNSMQVSMEKINSGSIRMTSIVEIINSISDKINLLSLNAAIEAARAGDAGRGFAVVADEVSKLADQTAASLKEIAELIKMNMEEITRGSEIMNTTVDTIKRIINGVTTMKDTIREIGDYMSQQTSTNQDVNQQAEIVQNRTEEIKSSSYEQKTASDEVLKSIIQVNDITQNNSEILGRLKGVSEEVAHMADYLRGKVSDSTT